MNGRPAVHRLHAIGGIVLMLIGAVHVAVTLIEYRSLSPEALWFAGSGFFVLLAGAVNTVLSTAIRACAPDRRGLSRVGLLANVAGTVLAGAFVWMTHAQQVQGIVLLLLFVVCLSAASFSGSERSR